MTSHPVPRGWRRVVAVDAVYYVSPDERVLWNKGDVLKHLTSRGTCKCGLQCPVDVDIVFCFNRNVPTGDELPPPTGPCARVSSNSTNIQLATITATGLCKLDNTVSHDPQENRGFDQNREVDSSSVKPDNVIMHDPEKNSSTLSSSGVALEEFGQPLLQTPEDAEKNNFPEFTGLSFEIPLKDSSQPLTQSILKCDDNTPLQQDEVSKSPEDIDLSSQGVQDSDDDTTVQQGVENNQPSCENDAHTTTGNDTDFPEVTMPLSEGTLDEEVSQNAHNGDNNTSVQDDSLLEVTTPSSEVTLGETVSQDVHIGDNDASAGHKLEKNEPSCSLSEDDVHTYTGNDTDDLDSVDEDIAVENDVLRSYKMLADLKFTDDSTDSISNDSDSNSLVDISCGLSKTSSNYLARDSSDDTATGSCDERMELHTNPKLSSLETVNRSSPPLSCMKTVTQKSNYDPASSVLDEDDDGPSVMDTSTSSGPAEDQTCVVDGPALSAFTIPTATTHPSLTEVTSSVFTSHIHIPDASPLFSESVCPTYTSTPTKHDPLISASIHNDTLSLIPKGDASLYNDNLPSSLTPTTSAPFKDTHLSSMKAYPPNIVTVSCQDKTVELLAKLTTSFVLPSPSKEVGPVVMPLVSFGERAMPSFPLTSNTCNEAPVLTSPEHVPNIHSDLHTLTSAQSTFIPIPVSQVLNPSINDNTITVTQDLSQAMTHSLDENANTLNDNGTTTVASAVVSSENDSLLVGSTQSLKSCQVNTKENDDDGPVSTYPAALKLSIDLSILPERKRIVQRARWAALLTTPVPVLRKRKRPLKSTVTVTSTIIKSDRKPASKSIPKKQLHLSTLANQYEVGEVLWSKFSHWSLWPCKIILHSDVDQPEPTPDQVWVEWFGDHSYSRVDQGSLKSYEEGLQLHLSSNKRKKYSRALKKAVAEVRDLKEGIFIPKGSTKKKKQPLEV